MNNWTMQCIPELASGLQPFKLASRPHERSRIMMSSGVGKGLFGQLFLKAICAKTGGGSKDYSGSGRRGQDAAV